MSKDVFIKITEKEGRKNIVQQKKAKNITFIYFDKGKLIVRIFLWFIQQS